MRPFIPSVLLAALLLFPAVRGEAQTANACFTCHERSAFQKRVVHRPVAENKCSACHNPHVARHSGLLPQEAAKLCYSCHPRAAQWSSQGIVHQPVRQGECLACHDAHASEGKNLLAGNLAASCFTCHKDLPKQPRHAHEPFAKGQCFSCHQPHQSAHVALLKDEPNRLCLTCHTPGEVQQRHPNYPAAVRDCMSCHNPHGSNRKGLVRNVLHKPYASGCKECHAGGGEPVRTETCLRCHEPVREQMLSAHSHLLKHGNNGCVACHSPHAGDSPRLLKGKENQICRSCHEATFARMEESRFRHTGAGVCSDCHTPHGSNQLAMTKGNINAVCIGCHENHEQFTHPIGEKARDPRTGHAMTCTTCHAIKGSGFKHQLRLSGDRDLCVQCHRTY